MEREQLKKQCKTQCKNLNYLVKKITIQLKVNYFVKKVNYLVKKVNYFVKKC